MARLNIPIALSVIYIWMGTERTKQIVLGAGRSSTIFHCLFQCTMFSLKDVSLYMRGCTALSLREIESRFENVHLIPGAWVISVQQSQQGAQQSEHPVQLTMLSLTPASSTPILHVMNISIVLITVRL